jgi:hypothetical protein
MRVIFHYFLDQMAGDMENSGRYSLAEFSRLHLESIKQAKPRQDPDPVATESAVAVCDIAGSAFPENGYAQHVVSGMSKIRRSKAESELTD